MAAGVQVTEGLAVGEGAEDMLGVGVGDGVAVQVTEGLGDGEGVEVTLGVGVGDSVAAGL